MSNADVRRITLPSAPRVGDRLQRYQDTTTWQVIHVTSRWIYVYDINDPEDVCEFSRDLTYKIV